MSTSNSLTDTDAAPEIEVLTERLKSREEDLVGQVETVARHHEEVAGLVERVQGAVGIVDERLEQVAADRGEAKALLDESQALRGSLEERLQALEQFTHRLPELRVELAALIQQAGDAVERTENVSTHLTSAYERIGGAEGLEKLQAIPERISEEAEAAQQQVKVFAEALQQSIDAHVESLVQTRLSEAVGRAEALVAATQEQLASLEQRLTEIWEARLDDYRQELLAVVEARREKTSAIASALSEEAEAHARTLQEAEGGIRAQFEAWFQEAAANHIEPQLALWESQLVQRNAEVETRIENLAWDAYNANQSIAARIGLTELQTVALRKRLTWVPAGALVVLVLLLVSTLAFRGSEAPDAAPIVVVPGAAAAQDSLRLAAEQAPSVPDSAALAAAALASDSAGVAGEQVPEALQIAASPEPAAPAAPAEAATAPDRPMTVYTWVVASTVQLDEALGLSAAFREKGVESTIYTSDLGGRTRYRVGLGFYPSAQSAREGREALSAHLPQDAWLLSVDAKQQAVEQVSVATARR